MKNITAVVIMLSIVLIGVLVGFNYESILELALGFTTRAAVSDSKTASEFKPPKLTESQKAKAEEIALSDPSLKEILKGKGYDITEIGSWGTKEPVKKARVDILLDKVYAIGYNWSWTPNKRGYREYLVRHVTIVVNLEKNTVASISPEKQPISYKPEPSVRIPKLTEIEKITAKEIVLRDRRVKELLDGKEYEIEGVGVVHRGSDKLGATVSIRLSKRYWIEYDWPSWNEFEQREIIFHQKSPVEAFSVAADFNKDRVVEILPSPTGHKDVPQLSESEQAEARAVVLSDLRIKELLRGRAYEISRISTGYEKKEASIRIDFPEAVWIEYDWPYNIEYLTYPMHLAYPPYFAKAKACDFTYHRALYLKSLYVQVDFKERKVREIRTGGVGGYNEFQLTKEQSAKARDIALNDPRVQEVLKEPVLDHYRIPNVYGVWYSREPLKANAILSVRFGSTYSTTFHLMDYDWLYHKEGKEMTCRLKTYGVYGVHIEVDIQEGKVISILPYFYS